MTGDAPPSLLLPCLTHIGMHQWDFAFQQTDDPLWMEIFIRQVIMLDSKPLLLYMHTESKKNRQTYRPILHRLSEYNELASIHELDRAVLFPALRDASESSKLKLDNEIINSTDPELKRSFSEAD